MRSRVNVELKKLKECTPDYFLPRPGNKDRVIWNGQMNCTFSVKAAIKVFCNSGDPVQWYKLVWGKGQIPGVAFVLWLVCKGRINTKDRVLSWGLSNFNADCEFCDDAMETINHLFFECAVTKEVWRRIRCMCLIQINTYSWQGELNWILAH